MSNTTIATNVHQSLDIHLDLTTEITFNLEFSADNLTDLSCLIVAPFVDLQVATDTSLVQYLC